MKTEFLTLGIHPTATAILNLLLLNGTVQELIEKFLIQSSAWYNGREKCVCIFTKYFNPTKHNIFIVFGEHRNSDDIFVDHWFGESTLNPPQSKDLPETAYKERKFFKTINEATNYITELLEIATNV